MRLQLDDRQVEYQLVAELAPQFTELELSAAHAPWTESEPAVRILAGGGQIVDADLRGHYGANTLAGVACEISGLTITAWAVLDDSLTADRRTAMLTWAEAQIRDFPTSTEADLVHRGWRIERPGRWQLLSYDGTKRKESDVEYAARATLVGPVSPGDAVRVIERLCPVPGSVEALK